MIPVQSLAKSYSINITWAASGFTANSDCCYRYYRM